MWIQVLRGALFGLMFLVAAAATFVGGAWAGKKALRARAEAQAPAKIDAAKRAVARGLVESALASRFAGRHHEALDFLESARAQDPALPGLQYQMALTSIDLGEYEPAQDAARRSIERGEEVSSSQAALAMAALLRARRSGSAESAREPLTVAVEASQAADPTNPAPYYVLAEFYRAINQPALAVASYRKALERLPKSGDAVFLSTVKSGLSSFRLNFDPSAPPFKPEEVRGVSPPEQLVFGAADALLRGDNAKAAGYLQRAKQQVSADEFNSVLQDPFFRDYLDSSLLEPQAQPPPQG